MLLLGNESLSMYHVTPTEDILDKMIVYQQSYFNSLQYTYIQGMHYSLSFNSRRVRGLHIFLCCVVRRRLIGVYLERYTYTGC